MHPAGLKVELDKKATKTTTSDTAPTNPKDGDLWYDSVGGELYVWYDDGAGAAQWVVANPQEAVDYSKVYTKTEADAKFVDVAGDTMTGGLNVAGDVKVGGTLPAKPHAALNADGSAALATLSPAVSVSSVVPVFFHSFTSTPATLAVACFGVG